MIVTCDKCDRTYDDATCWTICPHNPLYRGPADVLCKEHDLFNCPNHGATPVLNPASLDTSKFAVLTRADLIQEVLSIWDQTVQLEPSLRQEYEIAREWLTKTWTTEELAQLTTLTCEIASGIAFPDTQMFRCKPAWWKFWRPDRETFGEAWRETMVLWLEWRRRSGLWL